MSAMVTYGYRAGMLMAGAGTLFLADIGRGPMLTLLWAVYSNGQCIGLFSLNLKNRRFPGPKQG